MNLHHYPYCYIQCLGRTKYVTKIEPSWGRKWMDLSITIDGFEKKTTKTNFCLGFSGRNVFRILRGGGDSPNLP